MSDLLAKHKILIIIFISSVVLISYFAFTFKRIHYDQINLKFNKLTHSSVFSNGFFQVNYTSYDKLNIYRNVHKDILTDRIKNGKRVYTLTRDIMGYANRMYTVLSGLTVAILTDSACIIHFKDVKELIEAPLYGSFENVNANVQYTRLSIKPRESFHFNKSISTLISTKLPENFTNLKHTVVAAYFFEVCSNPIYFDKLLSYGLVRNDTVNTALRAIANRTMSYDVRLADILKVGFEVGGSLLNRMWKMKRSLQKITDFYRDKYFSKFYVIGLQIRSVYTSSENVKRFINCALDIENNAKVGNKTVKWFLSIDLSSFQKAFVNYKDRIFTTNGTAKHIGHHANATDAMRKVLLDIELLTLCDEIITTAGSTFGFLSVMKQQRLPFVVEGKRNTLENCRKWTLLSQPPQSPLTQSAIFK